MIGRMRLSSGQARVEPPLDMVVVRLTVDEVQLLADVVERRGVAAERVGDMARADRAAGRAHDLRAKVRQPAAMSLPRRATQSRLIAATWGAPA